MAALGAPANVSVFRTAVASTGAGGKTAFGGTKNSGGRGGFNADADNDEGKERIELREDSISLDQVLGPRFCGIHTDAAGGTGTPYHTAECLEERHGL